MATIRDYADPPEHQSGTVTNLNVVHGGDMTRDEKAAAYDRLRAVNAELLAALRDCLCIVRLKCGNLHADTNLIQDRAAAAIAKASEVTP